jgi:two-component system sensor histidine kinase UhpB
VDVTVEWERQRLDPLVETVLFRIAQEALTNVSRHAGSGEAQLMIRYSASQVSLTIQDQGVGFNPAESLRPPHGWGLAGMRERAESVGGRFEIVSAPGRGTCVEVVVPIGDSQDTVSEEGVYEYSQDHVGR